MPSAENKKLPFELITFESYLTLKLAEEMDIETGKEFEKKVPELLQTPKDIVVDCEHLSTMSPPALRNLVQLRSKLKAVNKQLILIQVTRGVENSLKLQGVTLPVAPDLKAALAQFGLGPVKLDVNFINPFLESTMNVLRSQCSTEAKAGRPYKKPQNEKYIGDISGVIGLVSKAFSGSVVIGFPQATFLKVMSRMVGTEIKEINKEIEDRAGELTSSIFEQAKVVLNEKGYGIKTAIPSVVSGQDHSVLQMTKGPRMVIPFESDAGSFFIEICVSE